MSLEIRRIIPIDFLLFSEFSHAKFIVSQLICLSLYLISFWKHSLLYNTGFCLDEAEKCWDSLNKRVIIKTYSYITVSLMNITDSCRGGHTTKIIHNVLPGFQAK